MNIQVNKKKVCELLSSGRDHKFVIPAYQRPYEWGDDEVDILFDDLYNFVTTSGGAQRDDTYFLGSIVSYENERGEQEIIDGQQRLTTLFLLLRAIYETLKQGSNDSDNKAGNMMRRIEAVVWNADRIEGTVIFSEALIRSEAISGDNNESFRKILEFGAVDEGDKSRYAKNYLRLQKKLLELKTNDAMVLYDFIWGILEQAIVLPITADSQDSALTIFNTLNDRGLPLSDADIFKAKIYSQLETNEGKEAFIEKWQNLEQEVAETSDETIQKLFTYYMFYLRAKEGDVDTTTPGVRKYYAGRDNKFTKLFTVANLLDELSTVFNIWRVMELHQSLEDEPWTTDFEILKILDILSSYPNEYWKYPVITYYLRYRKSSGFSVLFLSFLNRLLSELLKRYIVEPNINVVKSGILKLDANIVNTPKPVFDFAQKNRSESNFDISSDIFVKKIENPHTKAVRMILKVLAYASDDQASLLPEKWEVEHILPRKYQDNYFNCDAKEAEKKIEHIGNKLPFEKRLNIVAGNGYFGKKKSQYLQSGIAIVKNFGTDHGDWGLDDIIRRDQRVADIVVRKIEEGVNGYSQ